MRSRPCSGRRSCPGCRPAASSRSRCDWSWTGSGSGSPSAAARYWDLEAEFATGLARTAGHDDGPGSFTATLVSLDGRRVAQGRDFSSAGQLKSAPNANLCTSTGSRPRRWPIAWASADFAVSSVERKPYRRSPYAPFRTTTLQQEASRKLGFSAKYTMSIAQRLYENGYITYMRTDSVISVADRADRGPHPGPRAVRRCVRAGKAAHLRQQGEERPGGARGDQACRRPFPQPRRGPPGWAVRR